MKKSFVHTFYPFLFFVFKWVLLRIKPLFVREDPCLSSELIAKGFHPSLCAHPSILFKDKTLYRVCSWFLGAKVSFLKKCIKIGLLKEKKGHALMRELGMHSCFGNGVDFWFVESHTPIIPYILPNNSKPKGRIVVYTALTGGYDEVHEILYKEENVDYLLFTDNPSLNSETWQVIYVESELDNMLLSREIKMLPNKYLDEAYDMSIYIDANAVIYGELSELTKYLGDGKSLAVSQHSIRKSVKEEIEACVKLRGTDPIEAKRQYERYLREGFQDNHPLLECGLLVRNHKDSKLQELMESWYYEFKNGVKRDQLSLLPCINRMKFEDYVVMDGSVWHNQFNRIQRHKKK